MYNQIEFGPVRNPVDADKNRDLTSPAEGDFSEERLELARVLKDVLSRSSKMERLLRFVCERYFDGQSSEIKEYSIAIDAFGRASDFDPVVDSIVRVEAHRLRSKLTKYYLKEGAAHPIQIQLPPGGYVPQFIRRGASQEHVSELALPSETGSSGLQEVLESVPLERSRNAGTGRKTALRIWAYGGILAAVLVALGAGLAVRSLIHKASAHAGAAPLAAVSARDLPDSSIRIIAGAKTSLSFEISDNTKEVWTSDRYYRGGSAEVIPPRIFSYTPQSSLYYNRRRGNFSYDIPLSKGQYELRLYFADAYFGQDNFSGGGEGSRLFDVKASGRYLLRNFDVIADIGGSNSADIKIFDNIQPGSDGLLHLDFISRRDVAFVNAIEILPEPTKGMLPIRLSAWATPFRDDKGENWISDRYFRGGVHFPWDSAPPEAHDPGNFSHGRFGNFTYLIPVPDQGRFTLRLRFCKPMARNFLAVSQGDDNFNVYLNGKTVLENFSIASASAFSGCTLKEFAHVAPSAQGKMQLSFVPNRGYAFVNTIEILQDSDSLQ